MNRSQDADSKVSNLIARRKASPFEDWEKLHPNRELEEWRRVNEPIIDGALKSKERLETLIGVLSGDVCVFCDACDAVKCWGTIYPICAPILRKFTETIE